MLWRGLRKAGQGEPSQGAETWGWEEELPRLRVGVAETRAKAWNFKEPGKSPGGNQSVLEIRHLGEDLGDFGLYPKQKAIRF